MLLVMVSVIFVFNQSETVVREPDKEPVIKQKNKKPKKKEPQPNIANTLGMKFVNLYDGKPGK